MKRLVLGPALAVALLAALLLGLPAASYAGSRIGLSTDGRTWSATLARPLFDPAVLWVPGDVRTSTFYVRNQAGDAGRLSIAAFTPDPDSLLRRDDIEIEVRRDGGSWIPLPADGRDFRFARGVLVPAATTRIDVRVAFAPSSPNRSQTSTLALRFRVLLVEIGAQVADPGGNGHHGGLLPNTGGVSFWVLAFGVAALAFGCSSLITLRLTARREDRDD
jgi:hypothetical protein